MKAQGIFFFSFSKQLQQLFDQNNNLEQFLNCEVLLFSKIGPIKPFHACVSKISVFAEINECLYDEICSRAYELKHF